MGDHSDIVSVCFELPGEVDADAVNKWLVCLLQDKGETMYRVKGILAVRDQEHRFVFQAVHMTYEGAEGPPWRPDEAKKCKLVFIGMGLNKAELQKGFEDTFADRIAAKAMEDERRRSA